MNALRTHARMHVCAYSLHLVTPVSVNKQAFMSNVRIQLLRKTFKVLVEKVAHKELQCKLTRYAESVNL